MTDKELKEARLKASAILAYALEMRNKAEDLLFILQQVKERSDRDREYLHNEGGHHGKD